MHVVPDDVYGEVWVILVSAIHVGVLEMSYDIWFCLRIIMIEHMSV